MSAPRDARPRPPRLTALLLHFMLDRQAREIVAGDLEEAFHEDRRHRSAREARRRYRRHALASITARWRPARQARPGPPRVKGDGPMRTLLHDLRYGVRLLGKQPGFTVIAALMLGVGIGATTAIFSVANTLLLVPLPYQQPDRVTFVLGWDTRRDDMTFSQPLVNYLAYRDETSSFEALGAYRAWSVNLSGGDRPERVQADRVTATELPLLGVQPLIGRWFRPEEGLPGGPHVAILSYGLWQRRFAGNRDVVGRAIRLDGVPHTVVGVMPRTFEFPVFNYKGDLWTPLVYDASAVRAAPDRWPSIVVTGRLKAGVTVARAQADIAGVASRLAAAYPSLDTNRTSRVVPMHELGAETVRPAILAMFLAVGLVLVIACGNVANLTLARGLARRKEVAMRLALGASRLRVVRQLATESALVALLGGLAGLGVARGMLAGLLAMLPPIVYRTTPGLDAMGLNGRVLLFALALSLGTTLVFGLMPAWHAVRPEPQAVLKEGGRGTAAPVRGRTQSVLVVGQVALSLVILVAAGLLVRSIRQLNTIDPGFAADHVLAASLTLPETRYADGAAREVFYERALGAVRALPGVRSVALVNDLPFSTSNESTTFTIEGAPRPEPDAVPGADFRSVSPDYFRTLAIPLVAGRLIAASDSAGAPPVVLVNGTLARRYFSGQKPLGRRLRFGGPDAAGPWRTIVGVIGDVKHWDLTRAAAAEVYVPLAQDPEPSMTLVVRTEGAPLGVMPAVRGAMAAVDRDQPLSDITTLASLVDDSLLGRRLAMDVLSLFGIVALALAALGLYGVIAWGVAERTRDISLRMALGASPRDILGLVVRGGLRLAAVGIVIGLAGAAAVGRLLAALLYGVGPSDPGTYVAGVTLLLCVTALAAWIPARRAVRVDPLAALRD